MKIDGKVAIVTGAAGGIGFALCQELVNRKIKAIAMVDFSDKIEEAAETLNNSNGGSYAVAYRGDVTKEDFRKHVFQDIQEKKGPVRICVPAAGITRDELAVKFDKETGEVRIYPHENFRLVTEINLIAPVYWAMEMVAHIAEERKNKGLKRWTPEQNIEGTVVFLGSVASVGNKGQIAYSATKAGLEGAAATLTAEAMFHGVRCSVLHPGFTDTPMVRAIGEEYINTKVIPQTQLGRLIRPDEIADAICFMISNSTVSGVLWADAGWRPAV